MAGIYEQNNDTSLNKRQVASYISDSNPTVPLWDNPVQIPGSEFVRSFRSGKNIPVRAQSNREIFLSATEPQVRDRTQFDTGHEFFLRKRTCIQTYRSDVTLFGRVPFIGDGTYSYKYEGPLIPRDAYAGTTYVDIDPINSTYFGGQAISSTRPNKANAQLSTFVGEILADGLPRLPEFGTFLLKMQSRSNVFKNLGGEYLNVAFGWAPFISDIYKVLKSVLHSTQIIEQYIADSGKTTRRRFKFDPIETNNVTYKNILPLGGAFYFGGAGDSTKSVYVGNDDSGNMTTSVYTKQLYTFSGAYTYALQVQKDLLGKMKFYEQLANKLYGIRITPDVLWNLAPWSWLIDWWGDVGVATGNAAAFTDDGLVLKYGYLMRESVTENTIAWSDLQFKQNIPRDHAIIYKTVYKERVRSTPYGFGVNLEDLSDRQWAILGSLGLTRAPRTLR